MASPPPEPKAEIAVKKPEPKPEPKKLEKKEPPKPDPAELKKKEEALKKKGYKITDISKERIDELAAQVLEQHPQIREHAKRVVAVKQEVGSEALDIEA